MNGYLLLETGSHWRIGPAGSAAHDFETVADRSASASELATAVSQYCATRDPDVQLAVALHATSVVSARFSPAANVSRTDRRAMLYELESSLPFDAEDATADFIGDETQQMLGIAVRTSQLLPFVQQVEDHGVQVSSIFPAALAAAQEYADLNQTLAWRTDAAVELIAFENARVQHWSHLPDSSSAVARAVRLEDVGPVKIVEEPNTEATEFASEINAASTVTASMPEQVTSFAAKVLAGNLTPWIELRRNALTNGDPGRPYRKSLNRFLAAAAALLVLFSLACWFRASAYDTQTANFAAEQRSLFKQVFPGVRTNAPMSRLRSEHARLMSSRQTNNDVELPVSAIEPTVRMLQAIPPDLRVRYTEFRMENGKLVVAAEVQSFTDGSRFARALEQGGFQVTPEPLEQLGPNRISTKVRAVVPTDPLPGTGSNANKENAP